MRDDIVIIGGGLAGSEAAWQAAARGVKVTLYEMRPKEMTKAHKTGNLAELVCSNSLGSADPLNAPGILKAEMRRLNSLVIRAAEAARVPAGSALAVDREEFARFITRALEDHPHIRIVREEVAAIPSDATCIIATGPLTSDQLSKAIAELTNARHLYFYDAISPIIDADSIDMNIAYRASRYGKGGDDYLNCPLDEAAYNALYDAMMAAEKVQPKEFEKVPYFESCIPIEVMAERGRQTMQFGPLKPVGLEDPKTGRRPYAVVQLRTENVHGTCYNMVGFQTKMTYPEQRRVFRMIPGLEQAEFLRFGSLHRNTFINSPQLLRGTLQLKSRESLFFAGQLVGVEGYTESAAMGGLAGINAARLMAGQPLVAPPPTSAHGCLIAHLMNSDPAHFQPMNTNFGLFPPLSAKTRDKDQKRRLIQQRAVEDFDAWIAQSGIS
ncbi:MAG: Methylenetetrahydrofolate--tRNA-(uracil-5-)-methyltransferase TrmFO [Nitrospirae bacterium]|nr:MAG: tRNA uridine 5-carboxymethylaminomethyl modification enzyme gid [Nitrospira sp. OLB3]MBV6468974.1 Methylenetetrahydrofolate--tRNA-(uracil-5-)-methyltransferase TrmFO [Nitrospirota bacterium]MCE7966769.1 methylenetetrahydrofolate--tRNA-(uracil(54)-C(5))-methyltransferase (FADH(2)-oxidizing) TrmFO [Nitrospira sp. NTP2]MCK6493643.1 methylenetetrahydrofolate--tRNA-(uracil(54)-C(5))-methyltransferase (FADH(2)-oxidizing) TrmFO [Nitrospira sp.]MEB2338189.1 methylenetetrahydrofolate--tRNA-(urac